MRFLKLAKSPTRFIIYGKRKAPIKGLFYLISNNQNIHYCKPCAEMTRIYKAWCVHTFFCPYSVRLFSLYATSARAWVALYHHLT